MPKKKIKFYVVSCGVGCYHLKVPAIISHQGMSLDDVTSLKNSCEQRHTAYFSCDAQIHKCEVVRD